MSEEQLPREIPLDGPERRGLVRGAPSIPGQYLRAATLAGRPQGAMGEAAREALGPIVVESPERALDPAVVGRYRQVCGYEQGEAVPASFMETLFQGLMVEIVLSPSFPFSPFGVIHLSQAMRQHRAVAPDAVLDLRCTLDRVLETKRGFELEIGMLAQGGGETVWEGTAGLISRGKATRSGKTKGARPAVAADPGGWGAPSSLAVPGDTGRRYAAVSGDYNPFHLYGVLAKLFGFPRPIAHGMWTLARALAWVEAELDGLPEVHSVQASFKKPLLMPGEVQLRQRPLGGDGEGCAFEVLHASKGHPHLRGELSW
jgi:acyl dehydratase